MAIITLQQNEHIIKIIRKHWIVLLGQFISHVFLALLPVILFLIINGLFDISWATLGYKLALIGVMIYWLALWISFFIFWTDYVLDTWVLTNQRLIDIEQLGLFNRRISTLSLDKIQDVTTQQIGILDSLLHTGQVIVQSAAINHEFHIPNAKDPLDTKNLIMQAMQNTKTTTL
jgi:hypothetical protein